MWTPRWSPWMQSDRPMQCCASAASGVQILKEAIEGDITEYAPHAQEKPASEGLPAEGLRADLPAGPRERTIRSYAVASSEALQGLPLHSGGLKRLTLGESIEEVEVSLHVNGFAITHVARQAAHAERCLTSAWSPFSLVEKCQVKTTQDQSSWSVFKLTVFRREGMDKTFYFACAGENAGEDRERWVSAMASAIGNVTASLFPVHAIAVQPIPGKARTSTRIMAGYLLQGGEVDNVLLFYCELHAYSDGGARLAMYKDAWCDSEVGSVALDKSSTVSTRKGSYCAVFGVGSHRFCARTKAEKELWLRAVSNIKVKLMFEAPDPTAEDLEIFRKAVSERVEELPDKHPHFDDPLLAELPRRPPSGPVGDAWDPDPVDEEDVLESPSPRSPSTWSSPGWSPAKDDAARLGGSIPREMGGPLAGVDGKACLPGIMMAKSAAPRIPPPDSPGSPDVRLMVAKLSVLKGSPRSVSPTPVVQAPAGSPALATRLFQGSPDARPRPTPRMSPRGTPQHAI